MIEKALETGTFLEINSQPDRLDLSDVHARAAREAGLKLVIDSDAHQIAALDYVELGVGQARRAWLTKATTSSTRARWKQIERLRKRARSRRPPSVSFRDDLAAPPSWVAAYLEGVRRAARGRRTVAPGEIRARAAGRRRPSSPSRSRRCSRDLDELIVPGLTHWNHPRFFAYFANTGSEPGILAELADRGAERQRDGVAHLAGGDRARAGRARLARPAARAAARAARPHRGHRVDLDARRARRSARRCGPAAPSYASEQAHFSVEKAARILGLEFRPVAGRRRVPHAARLRARRRDRASSRRSARPPRPRSTRSRELAERCDEAGVWLHVDAAYAGSAAVCPELRWCLDGAERADSIVVNPHKWLFTPMDCSTLWTRRPGGVPRGVRRRTATTSPRPRAAIDLRDYGPALGRRFRALKLWAVLRCYGREGLQALIREHVRLAALFEEWVRRRARLGDRRRRGTSRRSASATASSTTTSSRARATATGPDLRGDDEAARRERDPPRDRQRLRRPRTTSAIAWEVLRACAR